MSDPRALTPEDDVLAAELALRLLSEAELDQARVREAAEPAFAAAVDEWNARLMPWLDAVEPVQPDAGLWPRILAAIDPQSTSANVVKIRRKLFGWRDAGFALSGIAAALLLTVALRGPETVAPPPAARASDLSIATVTPEGGTSALAVVSYDRASASLIVTPAGLAPRTGRSYELWVIAAAGGDPKSLGVIQGANARRIVLADDLAANFAGIPTIAISEEQPGGSRTGTPVGPVIATGKLQRI